MEHRIVSHGIARRMNADEEIQNRIVFDEAHLSHTAKSYRNVMGVLGELMKTRPPIVLMTGTCAPSMQAPMLVKLGLKNVETIRSTTNRPEIMYSVHPMEPMGEHKIAVEVQQWFDHKLKGRLATSISRVLIYVQSKVIGTQIAERLSIDFFESGTDPDEKQRMYEGFRRGDIRCLAATQAFGAGIDIGTIDVVIHAGSPRSMVDFAQESGRAGRSGQPAMSIVFRTTNTHRPEHDVDEHCGREEMEKWLKQSQECRRMGLGEYLDGKGRSCAMLPKAQLCDVCRGNGATETTVEEDLYKQLATRPIILAESTPSPKSDRKLIGTQTTLTSSSGASWVCESPVVVTPKVFTERTSNRTSPLLKTASSSSVSSLRRATIRSTERPSMKKATPASFAEEGAKRFDGLGANKRRVVERLVSASGRDRISCENPLVTSAGRVRKPLTLTPVYAELLLPFLRLSVRKKQVCFTCVGLGGIRKCGIGECDVERSLMEREGETNMMSFVNKLANLIKFDIRAFGYCGKCFLPLGRGESTDDFHAPGPTGGPMCIVFQMVASKALSCGCRLWQQKLKETPVSKTDDDPLWLVDLLDNGRKVEEPSVEAFARILKTPCGVGEHWFLRIFYFMIKEAVEEDEKRGG
ncbi:hypothetical protein NliqN6_0913 [Naganishia liquefaciens]|uniref:DNA 3'-5' helicase n=1 Tax=Naganishia liquefaciens TaxID=104408 RepID=A0A8H3TNP4_9TREE|nr:hypothetical protein NliqN6_0913 [Naganishia liquefaciens]